MNTSLGFSLVQQFLVITFKGALTLDPVAATVFFAVIFFSYSSYVIGPFCVVEELNDALNTLFYKNVQSLTKKTWVNRASYL